MNLCSGANLFSFSYVLAVPVVRSFFFFAHYHHQQKENKKEEEKSSRTSQSESSDVYTNAREHKQIDTDINISYIQSRGYSAKCTRHIRYRNFFTCQTFARKSIHSLYFFTSVHLFLDFPQLKTMSSIEKFV